MDKDSKETKPLFETLNGWEKLTLFVKRFKTGGKINHLNPDKANKLGIPVNTKPLQTQLVYIYNEQVKWGWGTSKIDKSENLITYLHIEISRQRPSSEGFKNSVG